MAEPQIWADSQGSPSIWEKSPLWKTVTKIKNKINEIKEKQNNLEESVTMEQGEKQQWPKPNHFQNNKRLKQIFLSIKIKPECQ